MSELFTKREVAQMLKCSISKIEKMMKAGEISFLKIGGMVRFRQSDLQPFFEGATAFPVRVTIRTELGANEIKESVTGLYGGVRGR